MTFDLRQNFVPAQYLGIVTYHFLQNFDRVMALDLLQNIVSAQYFENDSTESDQILYAHQH